MSRSYKLSFIRRNFWQLTLSGLALAGLLFMFVKAQPVDPEAHNPLIGDLRELQTRNTELGKAVLQHRYQLYHNYDGVVAIMQRIQALATGLTQHLESGALPDTPAVMRELSVLQQQVGQKAGELEEFKSHNAVLKNSLIYLPRQVEALLEELPEAQHDVFEVMIRDILLIALDQGEYARELLEQHIKQLDDRVIPVLPDRLKGQGKSVSRHAHVILTNERDIAELIGKLSAWREDELGERLEQLYLNHYQAQQRVAEKYRLLLLVASVLMLLYAIYAYYRMRERGMQLRIAAAAFETQEGILITDLEHRIIKVNQAFTRLTGYSLEEAYGKTPELLKSGRHDARFYPTMWDAIAREKYWQGEVWSKRKSGEIYPVWLTTTAVTGANDRVTHYVSVFADITLRKEAEEQIHQLAFYDPLTNLPNRRLLVDRMNHAMDSGARNVDHGAVLFIDLDNFKTLNDTQGHDVGDLLLVETAKRIQFCVRGGDTVARLGGDEFIVMLEGLGAEAGHAASQAKAAGEKIRESISQTYWLREAEYHCSCSIGVSLFRARDISLDDLLRRADTAMYEAKGSGRNALRFFDPSMQAALEARAKLEVDLRHAISQRQFELYYQVQVNSANRPVGAEALLRWKHPERGMVPPLEFIPAAEETGLIVPIGQWVLETACAQIKSWEADPRLSELQLAVNVSARQFRQADFVEQVRVAIGKSGANPNRLKLELTESVVLDNIHETIAKMRELKEINVLFSMDDFGTGYSSLAYLTRLPLNQLKVDQSFVRNIGSKHSDEVIVQTIVGMGNRLGMEVIAEGVETDAQRVFLERAHCEVYQGYLFGRPVPLEQFEEAVLHGTFS